MGRGLARSARCLVGRWLPVVLVYTATCGLLVPPALISRLGRGPVPTGLRADDSEGAKVGDDEPYDAKALEARLRSQRQAFRFAERLLALVPRETLDVAAVLDSVGRDPDKLLSWVVTRTSWVPYRGMLRGARGVLMDRVGNSLDRSLLLAALIGKAGHEVRIAHALLDEKALSPSLDALLATPRASVPGIPELASKIEALIEEGGLAHDFSEVREQLPLRGERFAEQIVEMAQAQAGRLEKLVGFAATPRQDDGFRAGALTSLAEHFWVEFQNNDQWLALDPLGLAPQAAVEVFAVGEVPAKFAQSVTIRVVVERWDGRSLTEAVPLEHTLRPAEHLGQAFEFSLYPLSAAKSEKAQADLLEVVRTNDEWLPILTLGETLIERQSFYLDGTLNSSPSSDPATRKSSNAARTIGALGSKKPKGFFTALWLEYGIRTPGAEERVIRRQVVDHVGPALRATQPGKVSAPTADEQTEIGLGLLGKTDILIANCQYSPAALTAWSLDFLVANRSAALEWTYAGVTNDQEAFERATSRLDPRPLHLLGIAGLRHRSSLYAEHVYLDAPNILTSHSFVHDPQAPAIGFGIDLVDNRVGVLPTAPVASRRVRLAQGVLDTVVEAAALGDLISENAALLFAASELAGLEWAVVRPGQPDALAGIPADARARIAEAARGGALLVAPSALPAGMAATWWQIDPITGTTLGIGENGWGSSFAERLMGWMKNRILIPAKERFGKALVCQVVLALVANTIAFMIDADPVTSTAVGFAVGAAFQGSCESIGGKMQSWFNKLRGRAGARVPPRVRAPPIESDDAGQLDELHEFLEEIEKKFLER